MKSKDTWRPSKFILKHDRVIASHDKLDVSPASRLMTDIIGQLYYQYITVHARGKLLDLGCGKAPLYLIYKDLVDDCTCVDWEENEHVDFVCDLTEPLPFSNNEFDTIILSDVLEHLPQPERLWNEMCRILAKEGKILINVPFFYWLHETPHDYYRYTSFALRRFAHQAGLNILELRAIGGAPEIMTDIFAKISYMHIPRIGRSIAILAQRFTSLVLATRVGRKISETTSEAFPFGYFLVAEKSND